MTNPFKEHRTQTLIRVAGALVVFWLAFIAASQPAAAADPEPLCRFGINDDRRNIGNAEVAPLRIGWYIDYGAAAAPLRPNGIEYAPVIRLNQNGDAYTYTPRGETLIAAIAGNPGAAWFIGNEPDRRIYQDDIEPAVYARAYRELYTLIKAQDPTARIFAGSIVQATEVRLKYLDQVLASYFRTYGEKLPVDGWSIHGFILNEVSCDKNPNPGVWGCWGAEIPPGLDDPYGMVLDSSRPADGIEKTDDFAIFTEQIVRFRTWMANNGYRSKPLYLSEYGVLMPSFWYPQFDAVRVNRFMSATFDYALTATDTQTGHPADDNRLIQRLSWYSLSDKYDFNGYLFDPEDSFTRSEMGDHYAEYTAGLTAETDLFPLHFGAYPIGPLPTNGKYTLMLAARIANSGNRAAQEGVTVTFYAGDPDAGGEPLGSQTVTLSGCGADARAQILWTDVTSGSWNLYVRVDPAGAVEETREDNNTLQTSITPAQFPTRQFYLPIID